MLILHIITGLNIGGAELMLNRLIKFQKNNSDYIHSVISLTNKGKVGLELEKLGIQVRCMNINSSLSILRVIWELNLIIRSERPDIIQTWMYHSDLLGGLASRLARNKNVIWGIRGSAIPQSTFSSTGIVLKICSFLSFFIPKVIVCCAESARVAHCIKGYSKNKLLVIPNGYDLSIFNKNSFARRHSRAEFGIEKNELVIGIVGRFDPLKDYKNFILAALIIASKFHYIKFLMIGRGIDSDNNMIKGWLKDTGFSHKFILAGERNDISVCLSAMDIFCLSSYKEGFPNVVCEAMAMSIPCVVTNTGDAAEIVGDTGIIVSPAEPIELAKALQIMINNGVAERSRLGDMARRRIELNYSIKIASERFTVLYNNITN